MLNNYRNIERNTIIPMNQNSRIHNFIVRRCFTCNLEGHFASQCRMNIRLSNQNHFTRPSNNNIKIINNLRETKPCNRMGHTIFDRRVL